MLVLRRIKYALEEVCFNSLLEMPVMAVYAFSHLGNRYSFNSLLEMHVHGNNHGETVDSNTVSILYWRC